MAEVTFIGHVFPSAVDLTIPAKTFRVDPLFEGRPVNFEFSVRHNALSVRAFAEVDAEAEEFWSGVFWRAYELAIFVCDLECLESGVAFFPVIERWLGQGGEGGVPVLADRSLARRLSIFETLPSEDIADLIVGDVNLQAAVSDLAMMLKFPNYAPIAGGRVLDSIVHMLTGGHSREDWDVMREKLLLGRSYIQPISDTATPQRHGRRIPVSAETNRTNADRVWDVMNRFLFLRALNVEQLDPTRFELLE